MKSLGTLASDIRAVWPALGAILAIAVFFVGAVLGLNWGTGTPLNQLTRDPAAITNHPFYTGFLSNVGILLWSATTAICLFSAGLVLQRHTGSSWGRFLYWSGLLTLLLTLDDLFLVHEVVLPDHLGFPEQLMYVTYLGLGLAYLIRFRRIILTTEYPLLGLAVMGMGLSVIFDGYNDLGGTGLPAGLSTLVENGAKFLGIVSWLFYFTRVSAVALQSPEPVA